MELKIIGKYLKEGEKDGKTYSLKTIRLSTESSDIANELAQLAMNSGATLDQSRKVISKGEYKGVTSFTFYSNCSDFTFDNVEQFGTIDCDFDCTVKGDFVNFKIKVVDRKEIVNLYKAPERAVEGWSGGNPTDAKVEATKKPIGSPENPFFPPKNAVDVNSLDPKAANDLPF